MNKKEKTNRQTNKQNKNKQTNKTRKHWRLMSRQV